MNDNGGHAPACKIWNAGMCGAKGCAYNGGTRAVSLWRWPGKLKPTSVDKLTAHVDVCPTLAELAGATLPADQPLDGYSLVPLLNDPQHDWPDRYFVTHVGRWPEGAAPQKDRKCSVRWRQWNMVREGQKWALYDMKNDPGESRDVAQQHADIVGQLSKYYDEWWTSVLPCLVNEQAYKTAPKVNPFKAEFAKQFPNAQINEGGKSGKKKRGRSAGKES